jgi:hypothetical protein
LHYTVGIPAFSEYQDCDHSRDYWEAYRNMTYVQSDAVYKAPKQGNQ